MKYLKIRSIFAFFTVFCSVCCTSRSQQANNNQITKVDDSKLKVIDNTKYSMDTLAFDEWKVNNDTLEIFSEDVFLDFPFGKYNKLSNLMSRFKGFGYKEEFSNYGSNDQIKLNRFFIGNSYLKFALLEGSYDQVKRFQIVSAKIYDKDIILSKGVHIEMTKKEFFSKLIGSTIHCNLLDIAVVRLRWDIVGVWHYYNFTGDTLASITIDTDYLLNKD
jgi:hypothetical protein